MRNQWASKELFHFIRWKVLINNIINQANAKKRIKYSTNSEIDVFSESLNKSKTAAVL